jgi:hypothetical protein
MRQGLGAFGLLYFTMLRPVLAWGAFWNLWTVYYFNLKTFSGLGKRRITETADTGSVDTGTRLYLLSRNVITSKKNIRKTNLTLCWPCNSMYHYNVTNLIHFHFHNHFIVSWSSTCFGRQASIFRRHYTSSFLVWVACPVAFGWLQVVGRLFPQSATSQKLQCMSSHNLQPAKSYSARLPTTCNQPKATVHVFPQPATSQKLQCTQLTPKKLLV